jgi:glucose-6-phosphate 1-dehydrogenase
VEKPFGHDLASARALNAQLRRFLEEWQILRIAHFLGKEPPFGYLVPPVRQLHLGAAVEPEPDPVRPDHHGRGLGAEDRGSFYDPLAALRDVVQNSAAYLGGAAVSVAAVVTIAYYAARATKSTAGPGHAARSTGSSNGSCSR